MLKVFHFHILTQLLRMGSSFIAVDVKSLISYSVVFNCYSCTRESLCGIKYGSPEGVKGHEATGR